MTDRLRVALVGLGDIGLGAHLPALRLRTDVELVALVDRDPARRAAAEASLAEPPRFAFVAGDREEGAARPREAAPSIDAAAPLLADSLAPALDAGLDAVVLATPPWATAQLAVDALGAGCFVLAEKPIAMSVAAAAPLAALSADALARLQVGLTYRHDPALERLAAWIADGRLGERPLLLRAHVYDERRVDGDVEHAERVAAALRHGSPMLHDGAHLMDWLAVLLGDGAEVEDGWAVSMDPDAPAPHLTGARLRWPGGTLVLVEVGWWLRELPCCELEVLGERGRALLDLRTFVLRGWFGGEVEDVAFPGERIPRAFAIQLERFVALCRGARSVAVPGLREALASLGLSERIEAAAGLRPAEVVA
jgi:myo-inositol 2-dehydrogenase/D-chiro-inositol 1-dehydrogenase